MENKKKYKNSKVLKKINIKNQVYNLFIFQINKLFKNWTFYFSIIFFPLLFVVGLGLMIPASSMFVASYSCIIISVSGIIFADLYFGIEKSTLKFNSNISNYGPKTKLFSISFVTFFVTFISILIGLFLFIFFDTCTNLFLTQFVFNSPVAYNNISIVWLNLEWTFIFYYFIITTILCISMCIFGVMFVKEYKFFIILVLMYLAMNITMGGIMTTVYDSNNGIHDTTINNRKHLLDSSYSPYQFKGFYSLLIFIVPTYFLNAHFAMLLRVGAQHNLGIYGWNKEGEFFFDPNSIDWASSTYSEPDWVIQCTDAMNSGNEELIKTMSITWNRTLNPETQFLKSNGDKLLTILIISPYIYITSFLFIGFSRKR